MQHFYRGHQGAWLDLPPELLDGYAAEMVAIRAEEQLARIEAAIFAAPAYSDAEVNRRQAYIARLVRLARGLAADPHAEEGRQVLRSYREVRDWFLKMSSIGKPMPA